MLFFKLSESEVRDLAKRHVETLEFWLRRVVDEVLVKAYGTKYWEVEPPIIKKEIREKVTARIIQAPDRFPRWIDATLLEHLVSLVCNEQLYREYFKAYFEQVIPPGSSEGKKYIEFIFSKCTAVRNILYHSNPISIRQAEQIVCYSNDLIDSLKEYYTAQNMHNEFNAPSFLSYSDSLGRKIYADKMESAIGKVVTLLEHPLRVGDTIKVSVEVDASFAEDSYYVKWTSGSTGEIGLGSDIVIELDNKYVGQRTQIIVQVISHEEWHRKSYFDDQIIIEFKVLPK